ncbi:MAG TPA: (2Fe-2S)-binding protein [Verrucomicrobiae bacterium]|nr:(2Fe-2S)-binding protein [Verrucomicrobiae bacterium]
MNDRTPSESHPHEISRRSFLKGLSTVVVASAAAPVAAVAAGAEEVQKLGGEKTFGPEAVPITLAVNGRPLKLTVEPRVTLLDALRNRSTLTGAKEVCDRATCGACTVLFDGRPIYSCMKLAIEAQGHEITTVEGLAKDGKLTPVQQAFVECDGLMCGYCTPGFVLTVTELLKKNPHPTADEVRVACSGNLCRCGTQPFVLKAALKAAGVKVASTTEVIRHA